MTSRLAAAVAVTAALTLAACGEDREGDVQVEGGTDTAATSTSGGSTATSPTTTEPAAAPGGKPVATLDVSLTDFAIDPAKPTIARSGVVTFKVQNDGKLDHALEVEGPGGEVETETIAPGASAELDVDLSKAGSYTWYCPIGNHEAQGMKGTISVGEGGGAAAPDDDSRKDDSGAGDDSGGGVQAPY